MPARPPAVAPLHIQAFRRLWTASVLSNVGSFLQTVAASWLMLELTGSPLWVGAMASATTLPLLFFALPAGALADLTDRRRILLVSQSLMGMAAMAMALLWFADLVTPSRLLALGILLGVGQAFNLPAWQALVPDIVPRGLVAGAVSLNSASFNVARAVGPALGGALVATAGPGLAFALNAVSYVGVIAAIASFRGGRWHDDADASITSAIALGVRYARYTAPFRWVLLVASLFALTSSVMQALLPNLTSDALGGNAATYGILLGAMGAGALVGAFTRQRASDFLGWRLVPGGITMFSLAGVAVGLSRIVWVTIPIMAFAGVMWVWTLATLNATTQMLAPAWVRGRVMSLYTLSFVGILPLGALLAGAVGDALGVSSAFVTLSTAGVVLGLVALRLPLPVLEEVVPPEPPADFEPARHAVSVPGGPVTIVTTWVIDQRDLADFLETMDRLRRVRLRTGAYRWRLYRNAGDAHRMTEMYMLTSWDQHLRQHGRLDVQAVEVIRRAATFDRAEGPVTHHLVAVDVIDPEDRPEWDELLAVHEELHRTDGSIPMADGRSADVR